MRSALGRFPSLPDMDFGSDGPLVLLIIVLPPRCYIILIKPRAFSMVYNPDHSSVGKLGWLHLLVHCL